MDKKGLEWKVGAFVLIGLVLLALLALGFSQGMSFFRPSYKIHLHAANVGGLKTTAYVLMAGVRVGSVSDIKLAPDGKTVGITLTIDKQYVIHKDAEFRIQQSGFLGDQYVAIKPTGNVGDIYKNGDDAQTDEPFDLQEVARSAAGFIQRIDATAGRLNDTIDDMRRLALNEQTLTNLSVSVNNMRSASERAITAIDQISTLFGDNGPNVSRSFSNLVVFTEDLNRFSLKLNSVLETNSDSFAVAVKNIEVSSETIKKILDDVHAGKGTAGTLLHNEQVASNITATLNNLQVATSNLNRLGLWKFLWHKETPPRTPPPTGTRPR